MALETHRYTTIQREVVAVRVTPQNMREVAAWCGGEIVTVKPDGSRGPRHIRVELPSARDERQKKAYVGDWVLKNDKGFRIFIDKSFAQNFRQIDGVDSVLQQTGIPAKKAAKKSTKRRPKNKGVDPRKNPVNPVMHAAMAEARRKLGAQEIVQGPPDPIVVQNGVKQTPVKIIKDAEILEVNFTDHPMPGCELKAETPLSVENSLDRLTGEPATVHTPPEDLVPIGTELPPGGEIMTENQGERQDPADVKKVDTAVETTPQAPEAEPTQDSTVVLEPEGTVPAPVEVTPEQPSEG